MLVELTGVLTQAKNARSQEEWNFVKAIAHGEGDTSEVRNIKIGVSVAKTKDNPAVVARSLTCWHATKKKANFTVFFRWITEPKGATPGSIRVIGYGNHVTAKGGGQTAYEVLWADGTSNTIDLKQTSPTGAAFLPG